MKTFKLLIISLLSCLSSMAQQRAVKAVEVYYHLQFVRPENGQLTDVKDSTTIFYYKDYTVYKFPYTKVLSRVKTDTVKNELSDIILSKTIKYRFVIYNNKNSYGYLFDSVNAVKSRKISIDSFQRAKVLKNFPFYTNNDSLVLSVKNSTSPFLVEKSISKEKDENTPDTDYYYYNKKLKGIDYTFSKLLDSTRKLKLYKVKFIYNPIPKGKYANDIPQRVFLFELRNRKPDPAIIKLIDRFGSMKDQ